MKKKSKKSAEHFWAWIANLQQEYWIPYVIIVRFSAVWFSLVLTYLGPRIGLIATNKGGNKYLSVAGWITTGFILLIILLGEKLGQRKSLIKRTSRTHRKMNIMKEVTFFKIGYLKATTSYANKEHVYC